MVPARVEMHERDPDPVDLAVAGHPTRARTIARRTGAGGPTGDDRALGG
jgi:hypothetical protein